MTENRSNRVAIIGGIRTPFVKAGTAFRKYDQLQLSTHAVKGLVDKFLSDPNDIDGLVWGRVLHDPRISNLAREIVFDLKLPASMVSNNCITSLHAMVDVADAIKAGRMSLGIAGGVESMSTVPILFGREASSIFLEAGMARSGGDRFKALTRLRPRHFKPSPLSFKEPSTGLTMGQHAEITAKEWKIEQAEQDRIAYNSHINAAKATEDGRLKEEIEPLDGIDRDTIVRGDTTLERLAGLVKARLPDLPLHFDLAELRGYHYHTGVVFAAFAPGLGQEVARGGRYDDIGAAFGRARPACGFSTDLKLLMRLAKNVEPEAINGIFAPWSDDPKQQQLIERLRAEGNRVVMGLPGQDESSMEMGCETILVHQDGKWTVTAA